MNRLAHLVGTPSLHTTSLAQRLATLTVICSLGAGAKSAMAANPDKAFIAADVHPSPFRREPEPRGSFVGGQYSARDEPMLNLIAAAYAIDPKYVVGGPSWLEWDRFDIFATTLPTTSRSDAREIFRNLLSERFKLITHTDTRPEPAFIFTVRKGKLKLKQGSGDTGCTDKPLDSAVGFVEFTCHNTCAPCCRSSLPNASNSQSTQRTRQWTHTT